MLKKLLKTISKAWYQFQVWYRETSINRLLKETGIHVDPEEDVWGIISKAEEDIVLASLYENKMWLSLMRKYAEGANKAMIQCVRLEQHSQALRQNAIFFSYNNQILKAKRAYKRLKDDQNRRDKI